MNMKKYIPFGLAALLLTGCGTDVPDLSKIDNSKTAEYMAGNLLKKDKNHDYGLDYDHAILDATPVPTEKPTEAPKKDKKEEKTDNKENNKETPKEPEKTEPVIQEVSATEVFGMKGVAVSLVSSSVKDTLGDEYTYYKANAGKKLVILYFRVKNTSSQDQKVDFSGASYTLIGGEQAVAKPLHTIQEGDLQYFNKTISPSKSNQGLLAFEIDKGQSTDGLKLEIQKDQKKATMELKL